MTRLDVLLAVVGGAFGFLLLWGFTILLFCL